VWCLLDTLNHIHLPIHVSFASTLFFYFQDNPRLHCRHRKLLTSQPKSKIILFFLTTLMLFTSLTSIILRTQYDISQIPLLGFNPPDAEDVTPFLTNSIIVTAFLDRFNVRTVIFCKHKAYSILLVCPQRWHCSLESLDTVP